VSAELARYLRDDGIEVLEGVALASVERGGEGRRIHLRGGDGGARTVEAEAVLVAAGRRPNTRGMGLETAGVEVGPGGHIVVDAGMRTTHPHAWAAGDVTGEPMHVYVAAHTAAVAAENALGGQRKADLSVLPLVTFTDPGVASVGLTEAEARSAGMEPLVSKLPMEHVPRALAARETRGFVNLVADASSRRILGAHVLGHEAWEMIMEPALALRFGLTIDDLASTLHPYLTLAEGIKLAALTFDKDVARLSCCAS
jgi:mercuric reductase